MKPFLQIFVATEADSRLKSSEALARLDDSRGSANFPPISQRKHNLTTTFPAVSQTFSTAPQTDDSPFVPDFAPNSAVLPSARTELSLWLAAAASFLRLENYAFADGDVKHAAARDWRSEVRLVRAAWLRSSHLISRVLSEISAQKSAETFSPAPAELSALFALLSDSVNLCDAIAAAKHFDFDAWRAWSGQLENDLKNQAAFQILTEQKTSAILPPKLLHLNSPAFAGKLFGRELLEVLTGLSALLERLKFIENMLSGDEPLKLSLLIFALCYEETRELLDFIQNRILRFLEPENEVFDFFDGTMYVLTLELRKVFTREIVGVSDVRPAPIVYARVETAHGLLQDCVQQSIIALAKVAEPNLDAMRVFPNYQIRLEQSLVLRETLWHLSQTVRRAETAPNDDSITNLKTRVRDFRQNSMRFLMYKDCETTERFVEEILQAPVSTEIAPVLHRFGAYLETLLGQVNMRTVLSNHPFDYPAVSE